MDILHLIDQIEEQVVQARRLPGGNLVLDKKRVLDIIDQMRLSIPKDIKEAKAILDAREEMMAEAESAARRLLEDAQREAEMRISESEITRQADMRAQATLSEAEQRADRILIEANNAAESHLNHAEETAQRQIEEADAYALEVLTRLEKQVGAFMRSIRAGIESIERQRETDIRER